MLFQRFEEYMQPRGLEFYFFKSGGSARVS
jgi:hypothetical protein